MQQEIKRYELCMNPGRDADVLAFWKLFAADLPNLARIARIVLAIPASSSKSERVFSTGGLVVSSKRLNIFFFYFSAPTGSSKQFTLPREIIFNFYCLALCQFLMLRILGEGLLPQRQRP